MKKELSAEEARFKAETYCSLSEHCRSEVIAKLQQWGVPQESSEAILRHLEKERYIDECRYASAFVRDKYRFNQWGRVKIANALRMKCISSACIAEAMEQIDEDEYLDILATLLKKKLGSVKGANDYERNGKLIRFAMGHGYEMNDILMCIKQMGYDNEYME